MRINKYLSEIGFCSRREADRLIEQGYVMVGNRQAKLGQEIDPEVDEVSVKGEEVGAPAKKKYYLFNKPLGVVCTSDDPAGRKTVIDFFPRKTRLYTVGRLDAETTGLIIVTNDGELTQLLTHPKYGKEKQYVVTMSPIVFKPKEGEAKKEAPVASFSLIRKAFTKGVKLSEGIAKADSITLISETKHDVTVTMTLHQGWNKQIRRMSEKLGYKVQKLSRTKIGDLRLSGIRPGEYRELTETEIKKLKSVGR